MHHQASCARLLAASLWSPAESAVGALLAARGEWLRRSRASGVRSALLYAAGWLVQWHEGSPEAVAAEWERLRSDPQLRNARMLHRSRGAGVLREPVQIASLHAAGTPTDVARRVHALAREEEQGWAPDPVQIWQALAAPCQLGAVGAAGCVRRREVVAVAGDGPEAVELARLLAQERGLPVAYQRYAGSDLERRDLGAAYVDLPLDGGMPARVQALPRRALGAGVQLLGLGQVGHVLLLLGHDSTRGRALLVETAALLQSLPAPAQVTLLCRCPLLREQAARMLAQAPAAGLSFVDADGSARAGLAHVAQLLPRSASAPRSAWGAIAA